MANKQIIDVDDVIYLANSMGAINAHKDLKEVEFHYDGRIIKVPDSEIQEFIFTGLSNMDFILNYEWPENPLYSNDD